MVWGLHMFRNNFLKSLLIFVVAGTTYLVSVSGHADIIDTPEHRQAERAVAGIPNVTQKVISTFDVQSAAACLDIVARIVGLEMSGTAPPMSSAQKYNAAVMYEIVGIAYIHYGDGLISRYLPGYEGETDVNRIAARARACDRLVKNIR